MTDLIIDNADKAKIDAVFVDGNYLCVQIIQYRCGSNSTCMCPHLILLYSYSYVTVSIYVSSYLILLCYHMCPHTAAYVCSQQLRWCAGSGAALLQLLCYSAAALLQLLQMDVCSQQARACADLSSARYARRPTATLRACVSTSLNRH